MTEAAEAQAPDDTSQLAFAFVQDLAAALSAGQLDLPSFPAVAVRVRQVLQDESVAADQVVRILGSEPALAARLLRVANSAALNRSGKPVRELKTAVLRLGFNVIRSAAIAFAVSQLKRSNELRGLEGPLDELWDRSALVAATCHLVARRVRGVNPDEAMLAGLLHGVGRLYVLAQIHRYPGLFNDHGTYVHIVSSWHAEIAKAILENWQMADAVVNAVHLQDTFEREFDAPVDLTDVLILGNLLASYHSAPENLALNLQGVDSVTRLGLDENVLKTIIDEGEDDIAALRDALGL